MKNEMSDEERGNRRIRQERKRGDERRVTIKEEKEGEMLDKSK